MDLWRFKIAKTKDLISFLDTVDFSFEKWDEVYKGTENKSKLKDYLAKGVFILKYQDRLIEDILANHAVLVNFLGYKTYAVNSPLFNSQIANALYRELPPIGIVWVQRNDGSIQISLRSDGGVDVSKIAEKFGGGGHKAAAGFYVESCSKLPWKEIK